MRVLAALAATAAGMAVAVAACGRPAVAPGTSSATASSHPAQVRPVNIEHVRQQLPAGYEVAAVIGTAPATFWGFGTKWAADPAQCGALADPPVDGAAARGWSGSGSGGIVYAVVAPAQVGLDQAVVDECGHWTISSGHTGGTVTRVDAPVIDNAVTFGLSIAARTVVEGGTETHSHADTFAAYLGGDAGGEYVTSVTVVTDPGASGPPLAPGFAAALLVKTVSALRD